MLIIDRNLKNLVNNLGVCRSDLVEEFCLQIRLSDTGYYKFEPSKEKIITYGHDDEQSLKDLFTDIQTGSIILKPGEQALACSEDKYTLPNNVFGLVQTKGTLARLFVQITCNDGQIEPGFEGHITLEIVNLSPCTIEIPVRQKIGQLYLFNCSMESSKPYSGKYANSCIPTLPSFANF